MKKSWLGCGALLLAGVVTLAAEKTPTLEIGASAPDFNLPGVDGKNYTLNDFAKAKILAVVFTCNHCPTAQLYEERLKKLVADYEGKGVAFVAISPNDPRALRLDEMGWTDVGDSFEDMKIRAKDRKFNFPYLYDGDNQQVSLAYGPAATPHVFIFDAERKLRYSGAVDNNQNESAVKNHHVRDTLDALLAGKPVPAERTRTFGCSIKWSDKRKDVEKAMQKLAAEPVDIEPIEANAVAALSKNDSDKLRLVDVWATWCGPCREEFPELVTASRMYRHRGLEIITISIDDPASKSEALAFLKTQQASNKNYIFNSTNRDSLADALDKKWSGPIPYTILIRPGGEIAYRSEGPFNVLELRRAILNGLGTRKQ